MLQGMPEDYRQALLLRVEGELSFKEIAELSGVSEETARWRVFKGRRWLEDRAKLVGEPAPQ
jgi:RNA polymerase sigma factor (sigma-70 family)